MLEMMKMNETNQELLDRVAKRGVVEVLEARHEPPRVLVALVRLGWKQKELAEALHLSEATVCKWTSGSGPVLIKHLPALRGLLKATLEAFGLEIERLRKQGKWDRRARRKYSDMLEAAKGALAYHPSPVPKRPERTACL